jgi:hypothetical protein
VVKTEVDVTQAQLSRNGTIVIYGGRQLPDSTHAGFEPAVQSDYTAPSS